MIYDLEDMSIADLDNLKNKQFFVRVWAPWCGHCVRMKKDTSKLSEKIGDNITVIDIEEKMLNHLKIDHSSDHFTSLFSQKITSFPTIYHHDPSASEILLVKASSPFATSLKEVQLSAIINSLKQIK